MIKSIAQFKRFVIPHEAAHHYDHVRDECRKPQDIRQPVGMEILTQLIAAAPEVLGTYNSNLMQAIFVAAYGFSMRVGEYTMSDRKIKT